MFLLVAGNETTRNLIWNCLFIARHPPRPLRTAARRPIARRCRSSRSRSGSTARCRSSPARCSVTPRSRVARLHAGDRVVFGLARPTATSRAHEDPTEFRLDRPRPRDHLAFGAGPHVCPGRVARPARSGGGARGDVRTGRRHPPGRRLRPRSQPRVLGARPPLDAGRPAPAPAPWQHEAMTSEIAVPDDSAVPAPTRSTRRWQRSRWR